MIEKITPVPPPSGQSCSNCDFYRTRAHGENIVGECRCHAPSTAGWPRVDIDDWCGEWEAIA